jgi:uncharacterized protein
MAAARAEFQIGTEAIAAGQRRIVQLPVSVLSDHTPVNLSVEVIHGRLAGPVMFVSAAVHGDEVIGVEIVRRLLANPALRQLRGTLLVVPIVNTYGFLSRSRYMPDRRDLNRSFPGSVSGSLASRLAHLFMTEVVAKASIGIDLHSAAIHRTNLPQIRISAGNPGTMLLAQVFGAPVILTSPERPGSLRREGRERGVDVLLYEAGEGLRFDEAAVRIGVTGILRVMRYVGMMAGVEKARAMPVLCGSSQWLRAPAGGLLRTFRGDGDRVQAGDVLAVISDPFGQQEIALRALWPGIVVGRAILPVVNEGDAIYHIGKIAAQGSVMAEAADVVFDEDEII